MMWPDIKTDWKTVSKQFQTRWSKLNDADLTAINGKRDELVTHLVKLYKTDKVKLDKEVDDFVKTLKTATV